jgi:PIN domain
LKLRGPALFEFLREANQPMPSPETQRFFSDLLTSGRSGVSLVQPSRAVLDKARDLRWRHGLIFGPMDSIHIATALQMQCSELLTRDDQIYQARAALAVMKLDVLYPADTAQLPDRFRQEDFHEQLTDSWSE